VGTHHRGTNRERLALDLVIKLNRAADSLEARMMRHVRSSGLTVSQFGVLDALYHLGPLCLGQIAKKHLRTPNNITSVVDTMEKSGLVERKRSTEDRRLVRVSLTDRGREEFEKLWPEHVGAALRETAVLSAQEQAELCSLLKKLGLGSCSASADVDS
jgi:MarR family 2-MHQ and catechol resistance regulon transcriptional repressor